MSRILIIVCMISLSGLTACGQENTQAEPKSSVSEKELKYATSNAEQLVNEGLPAVRENFTARLKISAGTKGIATPSQIECQGARAQGDGQLQSKAAAACRIIQKHQDLISAADIACDAKRSEATEASRRVIQGSINGEKINHSFYQGPCETQEKEYFRLQILWTLLLTQIKEQRVELVHPPTPPRPDPQKMPPQLDSTAPPQPLPGEPDGDGGIYECPKKEVPFVCFKVK